MEHVVRRKAFLHLNFAFSAQNLPAPQAAAKSTVLPPTPAGLTG